LARGRSASVVVVTGGNRGIGLEICRQLAARGAQVVLTARKRAAGDAAVKKLAAQKLAVAFHLLDVTDGNSIVALRDFLQDTCGHLDVLINNAGIIAKAEASALTVELTTIRDTLETNALGPLHLAQTLLPLLKRGASPRIVNMSSGMGALGDNEGGYAAYRDFENRAQCRHCDPGGRTPRHNCRQCRVPRLGQDRHGRSACGARRRGRRRHGRVARARRAGKAHRQIRPRPQSHSVVML
jgi:nucleoside-diphosphate-sugar epimerase